MVRFLKHQKGEHEARNSQIHTLQNSAKLVIYLLYKEY